MHKRLKVLVSAYCCIPNCGSEGGVGWNWAKQIARFNETWVITRAYNRKSIEKAWAKDPIPNLHWVWFDLPRWIWFWRTKYGSDRLYYYLWQIGAYFLAKKLHKEVSFDIVHHVTYVNYWRPSFLVFLPVPFIWGPVGGGESTPKTFFKTFGFRGKIYEYLRAIARWIGEKDPFVRIIAKRAKPALATTQQTERRLKKLGCQNAKILSQVAIPNEEIADLYSEPFRNTNTFRVVSIGRLLHWKGFHLGLMAFAQFQKEFPNSEYWLMGNGPELQNLKRLVRKLNLEKKINFLGNLPRRQVLERLADCDVLIHPSLHDSGGWVCLEAMATGRPVICLDLGGPGMQITEKTGFKLPAITPAQVVRDLTESMLRLAGDIELRRRMGQAGKIRVAEDYDMNRTGELINEIYQKIIV